MPALSLKCAAKSRSRGMEDVAQAVLAVSDDEDGEVEENGS